MSGQRRLSLVDQKVRRYCIAHYVSLLTTWMIQTAMDNVGARSLTIPNSITETAFGAVFLFGPSSPGWMQCGAIVGFSQ
jgi:hypothetical protein